MKKAKKNSLGMHTLIYNNYIFLTNLCKNGIANFQTVLKLSIIFSEREGPDDDYDPHEYRQTKSPTK